MILIISDIPKGCQEAEDKFGLECNGVILVISDIPKDCQEAKDKFGLEFNDVILIDIDGPDGDSDGNLDPFYAHCDVESQTHVAITQIPNKS